MAESGAIRRERVGDVLKLTIDNPRSELNTVDAALHHELADLFTGLREERDARAVLLTGSGRAFSAGGDYAWFRELRDPSVLSALQADARRMITDLLDVPIPIVCALNGPAIGLGASIALLCDVIFMAGTATIADPHVRVGIVAGDGGAAIWPIVLGPARAKQFLLTGDAVTAADAERWGLVNHVVPPDELDAAALEFTTRLAAGAPLALRYTKLAVNKIVKDALNTAFDTSTAFELVTFLSHDHVEAVDAIQEKRVLCFEGR